jgi:hypothetical protein
MLTGHYDKNPGRPLIEGYLDIPSFGIQGFVQFLIDTGADNTVLMPADAKRLKVDYSKFTITDHSLGSGGASLDYLCPAVAIFAEAGHTAHSYGITLRLPEPKPELFIAPSLLGRDILNRWHMTFHPTNKTIVAEVLSSDRQFPLTPAKNGAV